MSLWNPKKPLNQPPHFGHGAVPSKPTDATAKAALLALRHARNDRSNRMSAKVAG